MTIRKRASWELIVESYKLPYFFSERQILPEERKPVCMNDTGFVRAVLMSMIG